jgi:hypothetical protein
MSAEAEELRNGEGGSSHGGRAPLLGACTGERKSGEREGEDRKEREGRAAGGLIPWRSFGGGTHPCGRSMASTVTCTSVPGWRKKIRWKFCKKYP